MNWDRPVHSFSYPNGEPQTPTRTPTSSAAFGDSAFQTPKLESSFYDPRVTWDTSDPYASSPEFLRTPQRFGLSTPSNQLKGQNSLSERRASLGQHISPNHPNTSKASDETDTAKRVRQSKQNTSYGEDGPGTVESAKSAASIQTPPPTSTSRRKAAENSGTAQSLAESSRRLSTISIGGTHLETPSRLVGASPQLFPDLQASPDLFQFSSMDPSSSLFFPQQKLFWDQDTEQHGDNIAAPQTSADPFGSNARVAFNSTSGGQDLSIPQLPIMQGSMDLPDFGDNSLGIGSTGPADAALFPAPFSTSRISVTKAEDPAMFLSSPARRFGPPQSRSGTRHAQREVRQPYHYQTEESKREELRRARNKARQMSGSFSFDEDDNDDDWTPRGIRPGLTRSLTHSAVHGRQQNSGMLASTSGIRKSPSKGRKSPVKSQRNHLPRANTPGLPTRSQSLVLKIGKDGRAKTEVQFTDSHTDLTDPITGMDLDGSATESETDSTEYSDYPIARSHNPSFAFPDPTSHRPKLSQADTSSRPHSKSSSYSSTMASSVSGRQSPWAGSSRGNVRRSQRPAQEEWSKTPRRPSVPVNPNFTHGTSSSASETLPDPDEESGDAQHALRKLLIGRSKSLRHPPGYGARPTRSHHSFNNLRSSPPRYGNRYDFPSGAPNTSPTTLTDPDLATPSTDRQSNPSNSTRCICNSMDNGGHLMIQCESCHHWLHTKCVGLERANLPPVYVCVFCTQTPMRGGRIRDPLAGAGHAPSSPLAHKSFRTR
ncbi:hypothetical protein VTN00DRAFT_9544 [Thermoascus crustaceus]|uniref:uncharacterized protein n=1 Tax=Thermoascus crustaceus TaxID=5088 RepID=UPI0037445647